jgi:predicted ATP-grasp superfamily ATP-dependent carboligase
MNMFYTGLGVARSLGEADVPVIGLSAHRNTYGNFTRYARIRACPDSRHEPERLLDFMIRLGNSFPEPSILFPTRDDDVLFLDRFRERLSECFILVLSPPEPLRTALDKWETYRFARAAGMAVPGTWQVESPEDLDRAASEARFPCVLKPVSAHHWRQKSNWQLVGSRKAIPVESPRDLHAEYANVSKAESRALVQELVPGSDDNLWIAACYMNREGVLTAGFTARKLMQVPSGFGTGCLVRTVDRPDLLDRAAALLTAMGFQGLAEVEFKYDAQTFEYKLIEINPRPWDQHRLGNALGIDLIRTAYSDLAGSSLAMPANRRVGPKTWIAEDVFALALLRSLWRRDGQFLSMLRMASGDRVFPIASLRDPLPLAALIGLQIIPTLAAAAVELVSPSRASVRPQLEEPIKTV